MAGMVIGVSRFIWQAIYPPIVCGQQATTWAQKVISDFHYLHFSLLLFVISAIVAVSVSLVTEPLSESFVSVICGVLQRMNSSMTRPVLPVSLTLVNPIPIRVCFSFKITPVSTGYFDSFCALFQIVSAFAHSGSK